MAGVEIDEPNMKKLKLEAPAEVYILELLSDINRTLSDRLDIIESRLTAIENKCSGLEEKLGNCVEHLKSSYQQQSNCDSISDLMTSKNDQSKAWPYPSVQASDGAIVVAIPREKRAADVALWENNSEHHGMDQVGSNIACALIKLNSEDDYPNGSWLGDEDNESMRVRVNISSSDLAQLHSTHHTPEKMALALLDFLFDRDTQASSNISGSSKHGKQQLDPLLIYAIRCHLIQHFSITEDDWRRLKLNIDSKCRSAYRRKIHGMPLTVKAFRGKQAPSFTPEPDQSKRNRLSKDALSFEHSESDLLKQRIQSHSNQSSYERKALIIRRIPRTSAADVYGSSENVLHNNNLHSADGKSIIDDTSRTCSDSVMLNSNVLYTNSTNDINITNQTVTNRICSNSQLLNNIVITSGDVGSELSQNGSDENLVYNIDIRGVTLLTNAEVLMCESSGTIT